MTRRRVPPYVWGALVFLLWGVASAPADVKLRIYLQDGSLQSGNLVAENPDSFIILGKDGRVEIPKKNIMFVNGKTLKQWSDRPDKLFQTEIIPSDIPNPAYVNDKAAPPVIPAVTPLARKPVVVTPSPVAAATAKPAETAPAEAAARPTPAPEAKPAAASAAAAKPAMAEAKPRKKPHHERPKATVAPATAVAPKEASLAGEPKRPVSRRLAERAARGALHRQHGFALLAQGHAGAAMGELMIARLLEPDNGDTNLALARMFRGDGLDEGALKYLDHWSLGKSDAAAAERAAITQEMAQAARRQTYWQIGGGMSLFSWLPVVLFYRRVRRRRAARRLAEAPVEAVEVETAVEPAPVAKVAATPAWVEQAEKAFEPPPVVLRPPEKLPESPAPEPAVPVFLEPPAPVEPPPAPTPVPMPAADPPPVVEAPPAPVPVPEPEREPEPVIAARLNPQEILSMARSVENALVRGNAAAAAGRPDEARRYYRTALALNADCATAHLGLGYLAFAEEKWDTSLLHYRKALDISASADAHYGIARVLLEINRVEDAVPELRATLSLDPTYDDARDALTAIGKPA